MTRSHNIKKKPIDLRRPKYDMQLSDQTASALYKYLHIKIDKSITL